MESKMENTTAAIASPERSLRVMREHCFDYNIVWHEDFSHISACLKELQLSAAKLCIVTDSTVAPLYEAALRQELEGEYQVDTFVFPAGERQKNLDTVNELYRFLIEKKYSRKDVLLALGGGVTGDLCGFAAATYLRGIDFVQIPTTLLAQVDSSVGGKTGVDFQQFKNMVGAFYQPRLVYMNMRTLDTLNDELFICGMGEILKSALIRNASFYQWLGEHRHEVMRRDKDALAHMVRECCKIKSEVVESDPTEKGVRAILNFGHTIGHAVEKLKDFTMLHGQCVGVGMAAAVWLSAKKGLLKESEAAFILELNRYYGLPESVSGLTAEAVLGAMASDKKAADGNTKFILLDGIGHAVVETMAIADLKEAVESILKEEAL